MGTPAAQPYSSQLSQELLDAGKRASDVLNTYMTLGWDHVKNCTIAIRLADGSTDGILYDNKRDAVRHQTYEQQCTYISFRNLGTGGANAREMAIVLKFARDAYAAGLRFVDPEDQFGGKEVLMTSGLFDSLNNKIRGRG